MENRFLLVLFVFDVFLLRRWSRVQALSLLACVFCSRIELLHSVTKRDKLVEFDSADTKIDPNRTLEVADSSSAI